MRVILLVVAVVAVLYAYALQIDPPRQLGPAQQPQSVYSGEASGAEVSADAEVSPC